MAGANTNTSQTDTRDIPLTWEQEMEISDRNLWDSQATGPQTDFYRDLKDMPMKLMNLDDFMGIRNQPRCWNVI